MNHLPVVLTRITVLAVVAAGVGGGVWTYHRINSQSSAGTGVAEALRYANRDDPWNRSSDPADRERYSRMLDRSEAWYQRVAAEFPDLTNPLKDVPPSRNGYLSWLDFVDRNKDEALELPRVKERFDAKRWLAANRETVDQLQAIGEMPERSVNGISIDRWSTWDPRIPTRAAGALCLAGWVAAIDGDERTALAYARAALGLADHLDGIEVPGFLHATTAAAIRSDVLAAMVRDMMPALGPERCHPELWDPLITCPLGSPAEHTRVLRGQWQVTLRGFVLPTLVNLQDRGQASDAARMVSAYSERMRVKIQAVGNAGSLAALPKGESFLVPPAGLEPVSRELFSMACDGDPGSARSWVNTQIYGSMNAAAFEMMCGGTIPTEPYSGKPYAWDAARRELALPDAPCLARVKLPPLTVPRIAPAR